MIKTLLVSEIFPPQTGGSGRWFFELYRRLPRNRVLVAAAEHPRSLEFDALQDLAIARLPLQLPNWGLASWKGLRGYWRALRGLRRLIRNERVQMLHCGRCLPEGLMALLLRKLTGVRYACYVHGEDLGTARASREYRALARRVLRRAEYLIANSYNTARLLLENWNLSPDRVHVLHPGVDPEVFHPAPRDPGLRERLGWGDRCVLLTVGRLQLRKGHDVLIRALPTIRQAIPDVLSAIVGDGAERARLETLAHETGLANCVQFLGELQDERLVRCYQQCDLFVLPNRAVGGDIEGFGMVLLEAQACGKAVVAGASGGTSETMHIPLSGRVVPCESPEPLARELIDLLGDPVRLTTMGQTARNWVLESFDWKELSRRAENIFDADGVSATRSSPEALRT